MASQADKPRVELQVARIRRGFRSQQAAADAIGVERRIVQKAEAGQKISLEHALRLAAFYEQPVEDLFGDLLEQAA